MAQWSLSSVPVRMWLDFLSFLSQAKKLVTSQNGWLPRPPLNDFHLISSLTKIALRYFIFHPCGWVNPKKSILNYFHCISFLLLWTRTFVWYLNCYLHRISYSAKGFSVQSWLESSNLDKLDVGNVIRNAYEYIQRGYLFNLKSLRESFQLYVATVHSQSFPAKHKISV